MNINTFNRACTASLQHITSSRARFTAPNETMKSTVAQLNDNPTGTVPSNLWMGLWAKGEIACLFGEPCTGKSILAMQVAKQLSDKGIATAYFDLEALAHAVTPVVDVITPGLFDMKSTDTLLSFTIKKIDALKAQVAVIDGLDRLLSSQSPATAVLNTIRSWNKSRGISILLVTHSRPKKRASLPTLTEQLPHEFEIMHICDSVFSLSTANHYCSALLHSSHYLKQHKNRMAPVIFNDDSALLLNLSVTASGQFSFDTISTFADERQLLRDYGFTTRQQVIDAIHHYKQCMYTTREIAHIVGISQSQVSRILSQETTITKPAATQESAQPTGTPAPTEAPGTPSPTEIPGTTETPGTSGTPGTSETTGTSVPLSDAFDSLDPSTIIINHNGRPHILNPSGGQPIPIDSFDAFDAFDSTTPAPQSTPRVNSNSSLKKLMKKRHK